MKFLKLLLGLIILACIGGFSFLALTDIPVPQKEITTDIPRERFTHD